MKGQVVFEFILAAVFFLALVMYVLNYIDVNGTAFGNDAISLDLESRAFQVADLLVKSPYTTNVSLGSATGYPFFARSKIREFSLPCADFTSEPACAVQTGCRWEGSCRGVSCLVDEVELVQRFGLTERRYGVYHLQIEASYGAESLLVCGQAPPQGVPSATVRRAGLLDATGGVTVLSVTVW